MHVLYVHQHFTTNAGASGTRSYDYARYLVQRGHRVTVVTGVYALGPFVRDVRGLIETRWIDGIRVVIVNVPYANEMSFAGRLASFLLFAAGSVVACLRQGRVDVVLATSTPLTVGIPALAMRWLRRVPYVFEVRDIWPAFAVSIGRLKNPLLIRLAAWAERTFYRHAGRVQTISEGMRELLAGRGLPAEKLAMMPTGVDMALYEGAAGDDSLRRELGWSERLLAVYAGAHSDANGLEYLVETAAALKDDRRIGILLIGEGRTKNGLMALAGRRGLDNIAFRPRLPKQRLVGILTDADVGLVILKPLPEFTIAMPNKLFDYMAAGLAIAVNFPGDAAGQLAKSGAGVAADPAAPATLAAALRQWADRPEELARAKQSARELARSYDRRKWAGELESVLAAVAAGGRG